MVARQPARGELIARGNTSDVWAWSATTVVKVLRPEIPRHWASLEADITQRVHAAGLPAPATDGVVDVDGSPGVVLERIEGASMWSLMRERPMDVASLVEDLIDLQGQVLAAGPIEGLPDLVARLGAKVDAVTELPAAERQEAHGLLAGLPTGLALCHGDMHPANVLASPRGWIIVDWFDASVGHAIADLARSSLLMPPPSGLASARRHLDGATRDSLAALHDAYLDSLERRGVLTGEPFEAWEAVLAVARMSEPVEKDDLHAIWQRWRARDGGSSG